jgi:hypothetical protein
MPVILQQHFLPSDRVYQDVEEVLYHYPRQYFSRVLPFEPFIYYRPLGRGTQRSDSRHYFGHGVLGEPWSDPDDERLRFVPLFQYERFPTLVPLRDAAGRYYETGTSTQPQGQSAVRSLSEIAYHRILAAADVAVTGVSALPVSAIAEQVVYLPPPATWPKDDLRIIREVPRGAGYVPRNTGPPNVYEAAALQERARADHQRVLSEIVAKVNQLGGTCWYNNNIDLLTNVGGQRLLIEAKSLNDTHDAIHRMRYGMGQLFDYSVRYRAEIEGAEPVLAFGRAPDRETSWISQILDANGVGFVASIDGNAVPLNDAARDKVLFRQ